METNFIFAVGYGNNSPITKALITLIREAGPKGVGWWEIEAHHALRNANKLGSRLSLGLMSWVEPRLLNCQLSGSLVILTTSPLVHGQLDAYIQTGNAVGFVSLRQHVWEKSGGENWLDLQIKPEVDKFIGIISVLDRRMKELPSFL